MKRREFSLACGAAAASAALMQSHAQAQTKPLVAGTDYVELHNPAAVRAPAGKIEVVEFFWYSCPHCNKFEPTLDAWIKRAPKDIVVRRVPVAFNQSFVPEQRLFHTLEAMGLVDKLHSKVFAAIHVDKQRLNNTDAIANWVASQGVDKTKFMEQFNSFSVNTEATRSTKLQNDYLVEGVPALGVGGRFFTDGPHAGSMERALQVVEQLAANIRNGK